MGRGSVGGQDMGGGSVGVRTWVEVVWGLGHGWR